MISFALVAAPFSNIESNDSTNFKILLHTSLYTPENSDQIGNFKIMNFLFSFSNLI